MPKLAFGSQCEVNKVRKKLEDERLLLQEKEKKSEASVVPRVCIVMVYNTSQ